MNPTLVEASIRSELKNHNMLIDFIQNDVNLNMINVTSIFDLSNKLFSIYNLSGLSTSEHLYCYTLTILHSAFSKFITRRVTTITEKGECCYVDALIRIKANTAKSRIMYQDVDTLWKKEMYKRTTDFIDLIENSFLHANSEHPYIVEYQRKIMKEKTDAFIKSPLRDELLAYIYNPIHFKTGRFRDQCLFDNHLM